MNGHRTVGSLVLFFFFKQKTAYEMRISDWSSDVCSSDLFTTLETAELTKYAGNAFLATKITSINEIADLCEKVGADVHDVARGIGLDGRIGRKFLHPGPGYGGSCFPKDTLALIHTAQKIGRASCREQVGQYV